MKKAVTLVAALAALSLGCHKEEEQAKPTAAPTHTAQPVIQAPSTNAAAPVPPSAPAGAVGTIEGEVHFQGTPPTLEAINTSADPACAAAPKTDQSVLVKNGDLQNVLVRVTDPDLKGAAPQQPVEVDQKSCWYQPHVQGAVEGQKLLVRNDDPTLHNVHAYVGNRALFNNAQPVGTPPIERALPAGEPVVKVKCDVHPWMEAFVVVNHNPYFATSGADGKFTLRNVPVGRHTLEAWQEKLGTKQIQVEVKPNQVSHVSFTFSASDHPVADKR